MTAGQQGQTIAAHFGSAPNVVWLSAPITILTVVLGPIVSQAADYWGRKWFVTLLSVLGAVGSIVVSRAATMGAAIGGICVVGISFGAQPLLHTVASEVLPRRWRALGQATTLMSNCVGSVIGLLVGAALNRTYDPASSGFRYYFYMTAAMYAASAALTLVAYTPPPTSLQRAYRGKSMARLSMLDWYGYFFLTAGLVLFCVALSWSQNPYPWTDARVYATFIVGMIFIICLIGYELYLRNGMFHHALFNGNRNFTISLICVVSEGAAFFAANNYFSFQVSQPFL